MQTALAKLPKDASMIDDEILFRLAEERGIQPDMAVTIARNAGWTKLGIRVGFSAEMAARNASRTKDAAIHKGAESVPVTRVSSLLYAFLTMIPRSQPSTLM